jgi:hypothetical protein
MLFPLLLLVGLFLKALSNAAVVEVLLRHLCSSAPSSLIHEVPPLPLFFTVPCPPSLFHFFNCISLVISVGASEGTIGGLLLLSPGHNEVYLGVKKVSTKGKSAICRCCLAVHRFPYLFLLTNFSRSLRRYALRAAPGAHQHVTHIPIVFSSFSDPPPPALWWWCTSVVLTDSVLSFPHLSAPPTKKGKSSHPTIITIFIYYLHYYYLPSFLFLLTREISPLSHSSSSSFRNPSPLPSTPGSATTSECKNAFFSVVRYRAPFFPFFAAFLACFRYNLQDKISSPRAK